MMDSTGLRVAILLAAESFERFFVAELGVSRDEYVSSYRNDWAWDYCRMLGGRGVDATLYVATEHTAGIEQAPDGRVRFLPLGGAYRPWLRARWLIRSPVGRFTAGLASTATLLGPLGRALADDRIDVLLIQEYWTSRYDLLALRLRRPFIAVDQGLPDRHEVKLLKHRSLPRAHAIITQTRAEADKVRRFGGDPALIANGVDTAFYTPPPPGVEREAATALIVARLNDGHKRISDLLRAAARLPEPWRLDVLGVGPDEGRLRALADELGIAGRVAFLGFEADKAKVRERLRRCTVFVLPSAHEGLPVALLEAMACGTPAVGSDIPAIADVIRQGGGEVVPVGDVEGLAQALRSVAADRDRHGRAARATVEHRYSSDRAAAELEALIAAAAGRHCDAQG
jgi:glycosyltransferase involved in cell wall biosynthesis